MSGSLLAGCMWVVASAIVAFLPMRNQYIPGIALLLTAPVLIVWIGVEYGWMYGAFGLFAFVSMFRNPLKYLYRRARGERPEIPR